MNDFPKKGAEKMISAVIVLIVLVLLSAIAVSAWKRSTGIPQVSPDSYQAVILNNNQQYFGHLMGIGSKQPYLTDVYYVQANQRDGKQSSPEFTLIKFGNEIHGPEDVMYLNWEAVLYWETLKQDSQVVQSILKEKAQRLRQSNVVSPAK